jgi:8-oxo-dGTP diphosphatase
MNDEYREDQEIRIDNIQCRAFVIKGCKILVMFRRKNGEEYYVFPGGHMEIGETMKETAKREVYEESGVEIKKIEQAFEVVDYSKVLKTGKEHKVEKEYYFVAQWKSGEPHLVGEELRRSREDNYFEPIWIDLSEVDSKIIYSIAAKEWVLKNLVN